MLIQQSRPGIAPPQITVKRRQKAITARTAQCSREYTGTQYDLRNPANNWIKFFILAILALQCLVSGNNITIDKDSTPVGIVNQLNSSLSNITSSTDLANFFHNANSSELIHLNAFSSENSPLSHEYPGLVAPSGIKAILVPWKIAESVDSLKSFIHDLTNGNFTCTFSVYPEGFFMVGNQSVNTLSSAQMDGFNLLIQAGLVNQDEVCSGDGGIMITLQSLLQNDYLVKLKISKGVFSANLLVISAFLCCVCYKKINFYRNIGIAPNDDIDLPPINAESLTILRRDGIEVVVSPPGGAPGGGGKNNKKYKKTAEKYGRRCIYISNRNAKYLKIKGEFVAYKTAIKMLNK